MLDMGFIHDIRRVLELLPRERQSLLFSATFEPRIRRLAEDLLHEPLSIDVAPRNATAAPIRQVVHPVDKGRKRHLLAHMLRTRTAEQTLVFTRTKLAEQLGKAGISATAIHGNKSQSQRVRALTAFKQGRSQVLVATDIAARGLDIEALPHVVNYELPNVPEDYVHRIGRTGRAGMEGTATSLVGLEEQELIAAIEKLLKRSIDREVVGGFEPSFKLQAKAAPTSPAKGGGGRTKQRSQEQPSGQRSRSRHTGRDGGRTIAGRDTRYDRKRSGAPKRSRTDGGSRPQLEPMPGEKLSLHSAN
jgi:ATP-dependent RNA helicase RhlE